MRGDSPLILLTHRSYDLGILLYKVRTFILRTIANAHISMGTLYKIPLPKAKEACPVGALPPSPVALPRPRVGLHVTGELTIAMPLSSSTEWAADAPADATKVRAKRTQHPKKRLHS